MTRFLRTRYPAKTCEMVEADTGIAAATVAKWMARSSAPGGVAMIALQMAYGPEFMIAVWPAAPRWLDEAYRAEQQRALQTEIDDRRSRLQALGFRG